MSCRRAAPALLAADGGARRATPLGALLAIATVGCGATPTPRRGDETPTFVAPPAPAPPASASGSPPADAATSPGPIPSATSPSPGPRRSDPSTFACGAARCRAGTETCCAAGDASACVASVDDGPPGAIGALRTQWEQCSTMHAAAGRHFDRLARCDESADCPAGGVCCENFLFSGSEGLAECVPLPASGATPCDFAETCIAGSPCRLPGTECVRGACRKKLSSQRCDTATCTAAAPYCCGASCSDDPTCGGGARVLCTRDADCVKGERCLDDDRGGTLCLRAHPDADHAPWICTSAAQCASACNGYGSEPPQGRPVCEEASVPWLRRCGCSD